MCTHNNGSASISILINWLFRIKRYIDINTIILRSKYFLWETNINFVLATLAARTLVFVKWFVTYVSSSNMFWARVGIFIFTTQPNLTVGFNYLHIELIPSSLSLEGKQPEREATLWSPQNVIPSFYALKASSDKTFETWRQVWSLL
jgi:hypothetical protein